MSAEPSLLQFYGEHQGEVEVLLSEESLFLLFLVQRTEPADLRSLSDRVGAWDQTRLAAMCGKLGSVGLLEMSGAENQTTSIRLSGKGRTLLGMSLGGAPSSSAELTKATALGKRAADEPSEPEHASAEATGRPLAAEPEGQGRAFELGDTGGPFGEVSAVGATSPGVRAVPRGRKGLMRGARVIDSVEPADTRKLWEFLVGLWEVVHRRAWTVVSVT